MPVFYFSFVVFIIVGFLRFDRLSTSFIACSKQISVEYYYPNDHKQATISK
jgi:hypothetical protein